MRTGTVKWFDEAKGFGFIAPEDGSSDVFVHYSVIEGKGFRTLAENQKVEFEVKVGPKGHKPRWSRNSRLKNNIFPPTIQLEAPLRAGLRRFTGFAIMPRPLQPHRAPP